MLKIAYVFDPLLPQTETDTEQALNTVSALTRVGAEPTLFLPRPTFARGTSSEELRDYYKLARPPRVVFQRSFYRAPELKLGSFMPSRAIEKLGHAARTLVSRQLGDYDVVYTRNVAVAVAALLAGHKVAYETYRPWPEQIPATALFFSTIMGHRNFLGSVLHSQYTKSVFEGIGVAPESLEVVYCGFRPELFEPRLSKGEARKQLGLASVRPIVTYTGRVSMGKGLRVVIELAERMPDVDFMLVGSEGHGEVERRAQGLGNLHIVPWTPFDELASYLYASDVLLIPPSLGPLKQVGNTVLPMKLFLYLAAGRPILAPKSPDTAELLCHDDNAWLVAPDNVAAAEHGLRTIIEEEPLAKRLGERALKMAQGLTWDARAERVLTFLLRRIAESG